MIVLLIQDQALPQAKDCLSRIIRAFPETRSEVVTELCNVVSQAGNMNGEEQFKSVNLSKPDSRSGQHAIEPGVMSI